MKKHTVRKRLSDLKILAGSREEITMTEFRQAPGDILAQVQMGKTFEVTKNGQIVAQISPPEKSASALGAELPSLS